MAMVHYLLHTVNESENEKIIRQNVGIIKCCDQSGDRESKNDKRHHICSILSFNIVLIKYVTLYIHVVGCAKKMSDRLNVIL